VSQSGEIGKLRDAQYAGPRRCTKRLWRAGLVESRSIAARAIGRDGSA